jgi:MoaA/NifB/PqqE/SkfB family radical SAM enzyme
VVAFPGLGVEHDRQVNRPGAYAETCLAIQRVHAAGLRAGCNVFLTTANAGQAERLLGALGRLQVDQMAWEPATYYPMPRGRRNERLRPRPSELLPLADRIRQLSPFHRDAWQGVHFTETSVRYLWLDRAQRRAAAVVNSRPRHE